MGAGKDKSALIAELKLSGNSLYLQYVKPGNKEAQLDAILNYCQRFTSTQTTIFFTVFGGDRANLDEVRALILSKGLKKHTLAFLISARKPN